MSIKKIKLIYILAFIAISILSSCMGYEIDGDKVYYFEWNEARGKVKYLIQGADAETFEELEHSEYAIDKNYVYYQSWKLKDANPKTFTSILDYYGKDDKYAYESWRQIDGADGKTFEVIEGGPYSKDHKDYYYDTIALKVSDLKTFKIIDKKKSFEYWAKDKSYCYYFGQKYPLADYKSFVIIGNSYAKDKFQVYFQGNVVIGADPKTFKTTQFSYGQDQRYRFYGEKKMNINDPKSFEVLNHGYTKDKIHVYRNDTIVENADPKTFEIINWTWSKDKKSIFHRGKRVPYVDPPTFKYLNYDYAIDKNHVYYYEEIIKGADAKSFKILDDNSMDGQDKYGRISGYSRVR